MINVKKKNLIPELLRHCLLIIMSIIIIFPFVWMLSSAFKGEQDVFVENFKLFPSKWHFENFSEAMKAAPFGRFFINSITVSAICVVFQIITCSLAAYAFAKMKFRFKKQLFIILLATMMIPEEAAIIPNYLLVQNLHLNNTALGIALPSLTSVFAIFLLRQMFMSIPDDLINAAKIDGCGNLGTFMKIVIPNAGSTLATISLLAFLGAWNGYMWPYIVTDSEMARTLQIGLKYLIKPDLGPQWPMIMAASTMIIMPVLILFIFLQKYFVAGMVKTGIK